MRTGQLPEDGGGVVVDLLYVLQLEGLLYPSGGRWPVLVPSEGIGFLLHRSCGNLLVEDGPEIAHVAP